MTMNEKQHDIQSLQHAILFLQQEHANTLRGLYDEINRLQAKCTGMQILTGIEIFLRCLLYRLIF